MQQPPAKEVLLAQLGDFATAVSDLLQKPDLCWNVRPTPHEWSLVEAVCHLRDVEKEVHQPRFRAMIASDNAFLSGVDADQWVDERDHLQENGPAALQAFLDARAETIALLKQAPAATWTHYARHAFFGPTTLQELVHLAVKHDAEHWQQLQKLVTKD